MSNKVIFIALAVLITFGLILHSMTTNVEEGIREQAISSDTTSASLSEKELAADDYKPISNLDVNDLEPESNSTSSELLFYPSAPAFANILNEKYSQYLTAAKGGDRDAMYELSKIKKYCGDGIEGLAGEESYQKSIEEIDFMFAQGRLNEGGYSMLKFQIENCRKVYDLVRSDSVDWREESYELGEPRAVYLAWRKSEAYLNANLQEEGERLFKAVATKDPSFMMKVVPFVIKSKEDDFVEREAWVYLSCQYNEFCDESDQREYLHNQYLINDFEEITNRIDELGEMIENGTIENYNFK
ncbi:MAG: hypothetical protein KDI36_14650 [Pseudomonadales bacterium]|nr:hypothetical protein [Pseudomonadales bacterium]